VSMTLNSGSPIKLLVSMTLKSGIPLKLMNIWLMPMKKLKKMTEEDEIKLINFEKNDMFINLYYLFNSILNI